MIPNELANSNRRLRVYADFRSILYANNFYTPEILNEFVNYVRNSSKLASYISSYYIYTDYPLEPEVRFTFRKAYFNRFGEDKFNSMSFYSIFNESMKNVFKNHKETLIKLLGENMYKTIIAFDTVSAIYNIYRTEDNIIVIVP